MTATSRERVIFLDDYIALDDVQVVNWSPVLMLTPRPGRFEAVLQALQQAHPHLHVYRKAELPAHLHFGTHPRIPPIVGLADEGWTITTRTRFEQQPDRFPMGMHGYDPTLPSMHGILIAHGPAFARGRVVPPVENIHLYALMCRLLDLTPAPNDGSPEATELLLALETSTP
ncbi:alkaline phosphatase family protein [Rhodothermus marinus]|uniref:alkaline phosphatase family protein n=1 Tax=Rhodothermus marinus TaxID=29549 RepID=UPI000AFED7C9|nr:alkaline phosphatase family protein [Rhodothermus marinus]